MGKPNQNYRKNRLIRIPLLTAGLVFAPKTLFSSIYLNGKNFEKTNGYIKYLKTLNWDKNFLEESARGNYPDSFCFLYKIPENNQNLKGGLRVTKKQNSIKLEIRVDHPSENKLMEFSERRENGKIFYKEYVYNFNENRLEYGYPEMQVSHNTFLSLLDGRSLDNEKFLFYGKNKLIKPRKYNIKSSSYLNPCGGEVLEAKISEEEPKPKRDKLKVKKIEGLFYNVSEKPLLVAIDLDYEIKKKVCMGLITTYPDVVIRGKLTDKLDPEISFEKPTNY